MHHILTDRHKIQSEIWTELTLLLIWVLMKTRSSNVRTIFVTPPLPPPPKLKPTLPPLLNRKKYQWVLQITQDCTESYVMLLGFFCTYLKWIKTLAPIPANEMNRRKRKKKVTVSMPLGRVDSLNATTSTMHTKPGFIYISCYDTISTFTSRTGKIGAKPASWVSVGCAACKMNRSAEVLHAPCPAVCMSCIQRMSGVKRVPHATVVQYHIGSLHAFTLPASPQGLIEAFKFKTALTLPQDLASYPAASIGTCLLSSHSYVVNHVVDGAKEWRNLTEGQGCDDFY